MKSFLVPVLVCVFVPKAFCSTDAIAWCYHESTCNDLTWPTIAHDCGGSRQSPINILSASATGDAKLKAFTFVNFNNPSAMEKMENTGKSVQVTLKSGVKISGGNLPEVYDSLQFHFHWGNGSANPGSEHTVNGKRYPMELHIVNSKSSHGRNPTLAVADPEGLAVLGFFIDMLPDKERSKPASWKNLASHLSDINTSGKTKDITNTISLNDLLTGVNFTKYYRYHGSLTTPLCQEAVVWTIFKDPIKISKDLIDLFSQTVRIADQTSILMVNNFRRVQAAQPVTTQPSTTTTSSSSSNSAFSVSLLLCLIVLTLMN